MQINCNQIDFFIYFVSNHDVNKMKLMQISTRINFISISILSILILCFFRLERCCVFHVNVLLCSRDRVVLEDDVKGALHSEGFAAVLVSATKAGV